MSADRLCFMGGMADGIEEMVILADYLEKENIMTMVKRLAITAIVCAICAVMFAQNDSSSEEKYPEITFTKTTHDFGLFDREHGDQSCWFVFTNTGNKELLILSATATCGCTEPIYPKTAIMPGMKDSIKVNYNGATRRVGMLRKTIALTTNCKVNSSYLYITGEMVEELVKERVNEQKAK